ncbi:hypothetical protein [Paludibacterium sp.]|uniref:hypothetical protein n=1 Tax=Paludibacterium sp. TaxID=1917523 RepID=UPI0025EB2976|nr:hypothetical protein [Paludibacterium sp.]MBV8649692.1 hypothetical protein [Paludibacterium sp.]
MSELAPVPDKYKAAAIGIVAPELGIVDTGPATQPVLTSPYILAQSAVPVILLSAATNISATGAITGLTALPYQPSGIVRVYCFAQAGLAANLYYATFSSTTACQLYLDAAATITPSGIAPSAYTSGTAQVTLASVPIPGGSMGGNGALRVTYLVGRNAGGTSSVNHGFYVSGTEIASNISFSTANAGTGVLKTLRNRGSQNIQVAPGYSNDGSPSASAPGRFNIDFSTDKVAQINGQLVSTADLLILEGYTFEVLPKA